MRVRIEVGDGRPKRFKLFDVDTGKKIGLVQSVELNVNIDIAVMRFEVMLTGCSTFNGEEYWTVAASGLKTYLTPWLRGVENEQGFVFEDLDGGGNPYETWLESLRMEK